MEDRQNQEQSNTGQDPSDTDVLRAYWRHHAVYWWRNSSRPCTPVCDMCETSLDENQTYMHVSENRLLCAKCSEKKLKEWEQAGRPADYFGEKEWKDAAHFINQDSENENSEQDEERASQEANPRRGCLGLALISIVMLLLYCCLR